MFSPKLRRRRIDANGRPESANFGHLHSRANLSSRKVGPESCARFAQTSMAGAVSLDFLAQLEKLYPGDGKGKVNRWPFIAAVAFSAANLPEAVPLVFTYAVQDLHDDADRLSLVRKMKDAIFKSGLLSGYPKVGGSMELELELGGGRGLEGSLY